ncbi:MetQ/NlpA family ABC transporter substrate-binding protein [Lysinibacillus sphaericus]|uniref:Lipoprotein n=1 Tax=Lysinibacillus sphaericus TaxID=1421 RepID=A0A2S0JYB7_LYSSH|nr:MetQ/NlpA family ABC transporter substrate-binding protein [Lysinibacillus sphaericus]AVK96132.1 methionine ABC transporter substrate-binding protein [Lysinibacillus sphaericus]MCS1384659.1 MetQ/NlpA family ABC transporter substrate-binding protein [Lysinibacillus sphaericus]MED4544588.1 MetQ/NlpA family ABC transporter substrate-binding protein [Lysinibacillus sphaericus]TKI20713.1 MetQ/NlpA family ABC transporter substrate-binding protein [Lysinibacillus sphaericus]SUV18108.1 putative ABC
MKKIQYIIGLLSLLFLLVACTKAEENDVVKVGIRSSEIKTWEYIKEQATKEHIHLELVTFSAQYDPNQALAEGEVDINAFQHVAYLNLFNKNNGTDLQAIGTTIMAPIGLYSNKYKRIEEIKDGAKIAVPNDPSNWGRALLLLQEYDLLTVTDNFDGNGGEDRIQDNPKNLTIVPVDGATTPRVMEDTDFAVINNGVAVEAGLLLKDAIIHENETAKPFINVIVAKPEDKDNATLKKIVEIYQRKETADFVSNISKGNYIPVNMPLDELATWKTFYSY